MPNFVEIYFEIFLLFEVTIPNAKIYLSSTVVRIIWDMNRFLRNENSKILDITGHSRKYIETNEWRVETRSIVNL